MQMPEEPRTFKETVAAQGPADRGRLANAESFADVTVRNPFHQQVTVIEDSDGGDWRVKYFNDDGAATSRCLPAQNPRSGRGIISMHLNSGGWAPCAPSQIARPKDHQRSGN
jgi:hypothetical protein